MTVRLSLRLKLLLLVAALLLVAVGVYLLLAVSLMTEDKLTYATDLNQTVAHALSMQVRDSLGSLRERLALYGELAAAEADPAARHALGARVAASDPALVRVVLHLRGADGKFERADELISAERLEPLELSAKDLTALDAASPLLPAAVVAEGLRVVNRSLPPSAQLLGVAVGDPAGAWAVVADVTQDRLLAIFGGSPLYVAYLVGADGRVLTHPDPERVLARADLSDSPVVAAALAARDASGGALELTAPDGRALLAAYAAVGLGRLVVVSEIERAVALEASRRLVRLSALFGLAVVLGAFLVSIFFARLLTTPIRRLRDAAGALARGSWDVDPRVRSRDEIGELAADFRRMAREIRDTQAKLLQSEKLAAFGQLGAGIAHEVKNPLTSIQGFAELALRAPENAAQVREALEVIEGEAKRCADILGNLLRFARSDPGTRTRVDLDDVVRQALRIVAHQLSTRGVKLEATFGAPPPVLANAAQLQQVVLNLAINAQQAMPAGGALYVTTRRSSDGGAEVEVRDTGPGIPPDIRARIFEPFFSTKPTGQGTGLGLSVSHAIVHDHGGELTVESEPGSGATFRARFVAAPLD